jgi:2-C-methyl-D-erythritol 4-phosphate cytidylyltransferase
VAKHLITDLIEAAKKDKAAIAAVPVKPTVKTVNASRMTVDETLDRETLWEVQTPQVFGKELLTQAYQRFPKGSATDDAALVEQAGHSVQVLLGDYKNIKITTEEDLLLAEALLARRRK